MLQDTQPAVLMVSRGTASRLEGIAQGGVQVLVDAAPLANANASTSTATHVALPVVNLDDAATCEVLAALSDTALSADEAGVQPHHLAYVIYTSGSTGQPKGVMIEHQGACQLLRASIEPLALREDSRVLQYASFSFDASVWEWLLALGTGASLHLADQSELLPGAPLQQTLRCHGITHVLLSPAVMGAWPLGDAAVGLQTLIAGGDVCPTALLQQYAQVPRFVNAYGPTEASVCVTLHVHQAGEAIPASAALPIGRPLPGTRVVIVDEQWRPVPIGVAGEICIGGIGVARGYLNRPELTAERFVPDPFAQDEPGQPGAPARLYRSGDVGRWRDDGAIEYLGRNDQQVKVRGFRIETGEIEACLRELAGVREAVVLADKGARGNQRLLAFVAGNPSSLDEAGLRTALKTRLPEHMLPARITVLASLPMSASGKVNRQALLRGAEASMSDQGEQAQRVDGASAQGRSTEHGDDSAFSAAEQALAQCWSALLGLPHINRGDSFFDLGGHSLLVVQMTEQLRQQGWRVQVRDVLASASLAELAQTMSR
jgi:syringomycin synthetase protein SyrE